MNEIFFLVIPLVFLVILVFLFRLYQGSWFAPGTFFLFFWGMVIFASLILAPDYQVSAWAIWWITVSCFCFAVGSLFGTPFKSNSQKKQGEFKLPGLSFVILFCISLGLISILIEITASGYELSDFLTLKSIAKMGHEFSIMRYFKEYKAPFLSRLFLTFIYAAPIFGGIFFSYSSLFHHRLLSIISLLPAILLSLVHTTRASVLMAIILWCASYLSWCLFSQKRTIRIFTLRNIFRGFVIGFLVISFCMLLVILRTGEIGLNNLKAVVQQSHSDFFSALTVFSQWFENSWYRPSQFSLGSFTVAGLFDLFGIKKREIGIYLEQVEISPGLYSNIYTIFRGLIEDFTIVGSPIVLFLWGVISGFAYYRVQKANVLYLPVLIIFYSVTMWSFVTSLFNYNSIIASFVILYCYLYYGVIWNLSSKK